MAVGLYILSQEKRKSLSILFIILCIIQIIVGCGMTGSSIYVIIAVAPILHTEKSEVNFVFVVTGLYGTHAIFHWIVGINISQRCLKYASRRSTNNLLLLWTCMGTNTVIQLLILSHFARKMNKYIARSIKQSIITGMNQYLQDSSWKETIDKLQTNNECCGLISHEDWHEMKWLTKYHVDEKSETIKQLRTDNEKLTLPITPWSCCKINFPMQCLHDPVQQVEYTHIWVDEPSIVRDSINSKGCLDLLKKPIDVFIKIFVVSSSFLCIIHVVIFMISRILYTSSRNAVLLGDPEGMAPGWIFGRGDCGYSGGKSVIEIMETRLETVTTTEITEDDTEQEEIHMTTNGQLKTSSEKSEIEDVSETKSVPILSERKAKTRHKTSPRIRKNKNETASKKKIRNDVSDEKVSSTIDNEKSSRIRKKRPNIEEVKEKSSKKSIGDKKSKSATSSPRSKKKSPRLKDPSSGEETATNSIAEELKDYNSS